MRREEVRRPGIQGFQFLLGCFKSIKESQKDKTIRRLSIPSRMLQFLSLLFDVNAFLCFQFLLGCFVCLEMAVLPKAGWLSIPSRMLPVKTETGDIKTVVTFNSF